MRTIVTIETDVTEGGFPFVKGRAYNVGAARGKNLVAGGSATEGAAEGADVAYVRDDNEAPAPIAAPAEIPAAVVTPEVTPETKPEPPAAPPAPAPAPAPEKPAQDGIGGAEALTGTQRKGKQVAGKALTPPSPAK